MLLVEALGVLPLRDGVGVQLLLQRLRDLVHLNEFAHLARMVTRMMMMMIMVRRRRIRKMRIMRIRMMLVRRMMTRTRRGVMMIEIMTIKE